MRKSIATALVATSILAGTSVAQATPWVKWKANYIQAHHIHLPRIDDNRTLATLDYDRRMQHIWLKYMQAKHDWKVAHTPRPVVIVHHSTAPPPPVHYGGSLQAIVCSFHWSCGIASCIIGRESGWNTHAYNPSSGAAGLWQWLPSWYRGNFDPFNPVAATQFAWHRYLQSGWSDWHSDQHPCY